MGFERRAALAAAALGGLAQGALAQTADHAAAVKAVFDKSPVRAGACAPVSEDFMGWPAALVERCDYAGNVAFVLAVAPETMAKWIETSCAAHESGVAACFDRMLKCAVEKSHATFVVGGNLVAERKGTLTNLFFRNGVVVPAPANGKPEAVPAAEQERLARLPEAAIEAMPGGGAVAFWHTQPFQFAVKAIDLGVPAEMNTPDRRQKWLEIIRAEMQAALKSDTNRFLSGWMTAHPITLRTGECADDRDP
jgi:hypothetical protein